MRDRLEERIDRLAGTLERMRLEEYLDHVSNRRRLVMEHILYGMARGLGFMLGFSILGAALVVILSRLAIQNVPLIGDFLAEVIAQAETLRR